MYLLVVSVAQPTDLQQPVVVLVVGDGFSAVGGPADAGADFTRPADEVTHGQGGSDGGVRAAFVLVLAPVGDVKAFCLSQQRLGGGRKGRLGLLPAGVLGQADSRQAVSTIFFGQSAGDCLAWPVCLPGSYGT